jgi:hypothetical protein
MIDAGGMEASIETQAGQAPSITYQLLDAYQEGFTTSVTNDANRMVSTRAAEEKEAQAKATARANKAADLDKVAYGSSLEEPELAPTDINGIELMPRLAMRAIARRAQDPDRQRLADWRSHGGRGGEVHRKLGKRSVFMRRGDEAYHDVWPAVSVVERTLTEQGLRTIYQEWDLHEAQAKANIVASMAVMFADREEARPKEEAAANMAADAAGEVEIAEFRAAEINDLARAKAARKTPRFGPDAVREYFAAKAERNRENRLRFNVYDPDAQIDDQPVAQAA